MVGGWERFTLLSLSEAATDGGALYLFIYPRMFQNAVFRSYKDVDLATDAADARQGIRAVGVARAGRAPAVPFPPAMPAGPMTP